MISDNFIKKSGLHLIKISIKNGPCAGMLPKSSSFYTSAEPYPEITGYALTSFSRLFDIYGDEKYLNQAVIAANGLLKHRTKDGIIPTVISKSGIASESYHLFDTGIIARGFIDLYKRTNQDKYIDAAAILVDKITKVFEYDHIPSQFDRKLMPIKGDFADNFMINTKCFIPLIEISKIHRTECLDLIESATHKFLTNFIDGRFVAKNPYHNRTHYVAYAAYGLLSAYKYTQIEFYRDRMIQMLDFLVEISTSTGSVPAYYTNDGKPIRNYGWDLPVSAQILELLIAESAYPNANNLINMYESFIERMMFNSGILNFKSKYGMPFMKKDSLYRTVPWGTQFLIHYYHDKYLKNENYNCYTSIQ